MRRQGNALDLACSKSMYTRGQVEMSLAFLMLVLSTHQRSGLQVLKATGESHRKQVHQTPLEIVQV